MLKASADGIIALDTQPLFSLSLPLSISGSPLFLALSLLILSFLLFSSFSHTNIIFFVRKSVETVVAKPSCAGCGMDIADSGLRAASDIFHKVPKYRLSSFFMLSDRLSYPPNNRIALYVEDAEGHWVGPVCGLRKGGIATLVARSC